QTNVTTNPSTNATAVTMANPPAVTTTSPSGTTTVSVGGLAAPNDWVTLAISLAGTFAVAANLAALSWFGMWMGLNPQNTNLAPVKTILFVQIIPWFVVSFASVMLVPFVLWSSLMKGSSPSPSLIMVW